MIESPVKKTKSQIQSERVQALFEEMDKQNGIAPIENIKSSTGESFKELFEESLKTSDFKVGDVVKGRVISVGDDHVLVDINYKSEGMISKSEFRLVANKEKIEVGQELEVYIDKIENDEGDDGAIQRQSGYSPYMERYFKSG